MQPSGAGLSVWYISKYVIPPGCGAVGTRGFFLLREMTRTGHASVLINSDSNHLADIPAVEAAARTQEIGGSSCAR